MITVMKNLYAPFALLSVVAIKAPRWIAARVWTVSQIWAVAHKQDIERT
jgi:hypothetical protein